jgi:hypothetical protein
VATEQSKGLNLPDVELEGFISAKDFESPPVPEDVKPVLHPIFQRSVSGSSSDTPLNRSSKAKPKRKGKRKFDVEEEPVLRDLEYGEEDDEVVLLDRIDKLPATEGLPNGVNIQSVSSDVCITAYAYRLYTAILRYVPF